MMDGGWVDRATLSDVSEPARVLAMRDVVRKVLAEYQAAYFALHELAHTVEDMRILSLNAELAAGRAGSRGAAVRVATHSIRELVRHLTSITAQMTEARGRSYRFGALAMRGLPRVARFARTAQRIETCGSTYAASGVAALRRAEADRLADAMAEISGLVDGGRTLNAMAGSLAGLIMSAVAIANNIAIEATAVRGFETTFALVASDMHRHIRELRAMIDRATHHIGAGNHAAGPLELYVRQIKGALG